MRALPNLDDEAAMLKRGRLSVIISASKKKRAAQLGVTA